MNLYYPTVSAGKSISSHVLFVINHSFTAPVVPTTTTGPMTTGFTLASSQVVVLTATLEKPFVKELENRSSEQYRELERQVVTTVSKLGSFTTVDAVFSNSSILCDFF